MTTTLHEALVYATDVAEPIIRDGAADRLTEAHLDVARRVLAAKRPEGPDVAVLAEVVALGFEYLRNVEGDDPTEDEVIGQVGPHPLGTVRDWAAWQCSRVG